MIRALKHGIRDSVGRPNGVRIGGLVFRRRATDDYFLDIEHSYILNLI